MESGFSRQRAVQERRKFATNMKRGQRETRCLDRTLFWTTTDLEAKLLDFQHYCNEHRTQPYAKGTRPQRASTLITHSQTSVVIDGRSIVEVIPNADCRLSLVICHRHHAAKILASQDFAK